MGMCFNLTGKDENASKSIYDMEMCVEENSDLWDTLPDTGWLDAWGYKWMQLGDLTVVDRKEMGLDIYNTYDKKKVTFLNVPGVEALRIFLNNGKSEEKNHVDDHCGIITVYLSVGQLPLDKSIAFTEKMKDKLVGQKGLDNFRWIIVPTRSSETKVEITKF